MRPAPLLALLTAVTSAQAAPVVEAEPSRLVLGPRARAEITIRDSGPELHGAVFSGDPERGDALITRHVGSLSRQGNARTGVRNALGVERQLRQADLLAERRAYGGGGTP